MSDVFAVKQKAIAANYDKSLTLEEKRQAWRNVLMACHAERLEAAKLKYGMSYARDVRLGDTEWDAKAQIETITKMIVKQRAAEKAAA
ncbi:hypothetical protein PHIN3_7 [Sinorhizobium phage phiN3]|uniref:Uncharacterized protein n=1 Tax=Sinorhizobium phage phiN3 TaxID=1647405 RepID=A0A0F6WCN2_9CAUD|nr:hypothetical protein AVT40_gp007 [Sinorhizobium phage phiN3]AKF13274.1 hypothetical protein PHIN3_7 [Sinorhizobium phage phiN3]